MANDVRPWALSRLPVASQKSPNDRFAALFAPLERVLASALAKRNSPPPACAEQESLWMPTSPSTHTTSRVICVHLVPETRGLNLSF